MSNPSLNLSINDILYQFERNYGLAPFCTAVLAFPETDSLGKHKKEIWFDDQVFSIVILNFNGYSRRKDWHVLERVDASI